jgi:hypothetical protein
MARVEHVTQASAGDVSNGALSAAAAAANTVVADTGPLAAGVYDVEYQLHIGMLATAAAGVELVVEHRNAANNGNLSVLAGCPGGGAGSGRLSRVAVAANERIRVVVGAVALRASVKAAARLDVHRLP